VLGRRTRLPALPEAAEPQRVADDGDRADGHRDCGEHRRQDPGGGQRDEHQVVAEGLAQVLPDYPAGGSRQQHRVGDGAALALLAPGELDAVLSHEAVHARRRDPLRRLIARAAADTLFYLPLARWWSRRQTETADLRADQAAVRYAGRQAVASALLAVGEAAAPTSASRSCSAMSFPRGTRRPRW
jgi:hypothetical protein